MTITAQKFDDANKDRACTLSQRLGISERFALLLLSRGMREDEVVPFLKPSIADMSSPFAIDGMKAAADRLLKAVKNKESILIFGDYDCDGICAISVLMLALRDRADVFYFIPDRNKDGYGMSVDALKSIIASRRPDIVVTVDCGITSAAEVDYLKSEGIDVIVTDHHEPQEVLPDCIIVDAKLSKQGFYDYCGAGVALKLVEAMFGRDEAVKYIDIAAIATIADVVPLRADNRIIAYFGLKAIKEKPRKGISLLLGRDSADSGEIMFKLAPKINAAGRLGSAMKAVDLFLGDDYFLLKSLCEELNRDNEKRKERCEKVVADAKKMLRGRDFSKVGMIALYGEGWEAGVLGIAAARLTEEFKRPSVLFTDSGGELKGSARSVPSVNVFELFSSLSSYFISFGGHAQAAGASVEKARFDEFAKAVNEKVLSEHSLDEFTPDTECEMSLDDNGNLLRFAKELQMLEPTGYGNPKPTFLMSGENFKFESIGFTPHVKCKRNGCDLLGFSRFPMLVAAGAGSVRLEVTLGINTFQNNVSAEGIIKSAAIEKLNVSDEACAVNSLHQLEYEGRVDVEQIDADRLSELLAMPFGTLVVCFNGSDYERLINAVGRAADAGVAVGNTGRLNPQTTVLVAPQQDFDFGFYSDVVICGRPLSDGYIAYIEKFGVKTYAFGDCSANRISVTLPRMRSVFNELRALSSGRERAQSPSKLFALIRDKLKISQSEFFATLKMLQDTDLISVSERGIINVSNKKTDLTQSVVYRNIIAQ